MVGADVLSHYGQRNHKEGAVSTTPNQPQREAPFFTSVRNWGITRGDNGLLGGVVEGVGDRIGLARVPARLLAVLLIPLTGGLFLAAYAAAWAILPNSEGNIIIQDFGRGTPNVPALIGITILGLVGLNGPFVSHPFGWGWAGVVISVFIGLFIVAGIIAIIAWALTKDEDGQSRLIVEFRGSDAAKARMKKAKEAAREAGRNAREAAREAHRGAKEAGAAAAAKSKSAAKKAKAAASEIRDAVAVKAGSEPESEDSSGALPPMSPSTPRYLRPRVPGPSAAVKLLALGAAFLIGAIVWWLDWEDLLNTTPVEAWLAGMIVVVGLAIIITGAMGRRIGAFGFWATVLVIGWSIRIVVGPDFTAWLDAHDFFWDSGEDNLRLVSVEDGTIDCRAFDDSTPTSTTTIEAGGDASDGYKDTVTITEANTILVVPRHSSVTLDGRWGNLDATVSWERHKGSNDWVQYATCDIDGDSARFRTLGEHGATIDVVVEVSDATVIIKEN